MLNQSVLCFFKEQKCYALLSLTQEGKKEQIKVFLIYIESNKIQGSNYVFLE